MKQLNTKTYYYNHRGELESIELVKGLADAFDSYEMYNNKALYIVEVNDKGFSVYRRSDSSKVYDVVITDEELR